MKKTTRWILRIAGGGVAAIILLLAVAAIIVSRPSFRAQLLKQATEMLADKLQTRVSIDSASISVLKGDVGLYGVEIDDRQQRKMLRIEQLKVNVSTTDLLDKRIVIREAAVKGLDAMLLKPSKDEEANYQFVIDAFKKDKNDKPKEKDDKEKGKQLSFDIDKVMLEDIHVTYNEHGFKLHQALYGKKGEDITLKLNDLETSWESESKKGAVSNSVYIAQLTAKLEAEEKQLSIERLNFKTDNHQPRKNANKPKRGYFDVGHLDITADLRVDIDSFSQENIKGRLTQCVARDSLTGIDIRDLHTAFDATKEKVLLSDIGIQQQDTKLSIDRAELTLPNKKTGRPLSYSTGTITGKVLLKDISRTFAPVLNKFTLPLNLSASMSGSDSTMSFRNIIVKTDDKKLNIQATGDIKNLKDKEKLDIRFNVNKMTARGDIKEKVINQFAVKKLMMKQLRNLGDITYTGQFAVLWKREVFQGTLGTAVGPLNFQFALDEQNKYVSGTASSKALNLGKVMDIKNIGDIAANAKFKIDISKPRTAQMRKTKGGKLPIGQVNATVEDCSYQGIHVRHVSVNIDSDGAIASGDIRQYGNYRDLYCSFSFSNTDDMRKMKITKPGIKFHKMSEENRKAKEERQQKKAKEKEERKVQKDKEPKKKKFLGIF